MSRFVQPILYMYLSSTNIKQAEIFITNLYVENASVTLHCMWLQQPVDAQCYKIGIVKVYPTDSHTSVSWFVTHVCFYASAKNRQRNQITWHAAKTGKYVIVIHMFIACTT